MAETAPVPFFDPDPLSHGNFSGQVYAPVAPCRVLSIEEISLAEELGDPFPGYPFCIRSITLFCHAQQ